MKVYVVITGGYYSYPIFKKVFDTYDSAVKYKQELFNDSENITDWEHDDHELEFEEIMIETVEFIKG